MAKLPEAFRPWLHMPTGDELDDETCTDCWGTGWNGNMEQVCDCQPADPGPSLPVGIPAFHALTVYRLNSGAYQAAIMGAKYDGWTVAVEKFANDAISACIKMRFGA